MGTVSIHGRASEGPGQLVSASWTVAGAGSAHSPTGAEGALWMLAWCLLNQFLRVNQERLVSVSISQLVFESKGGLKYCEAFESCW